jgi:hypothetical protein
MKKGPRLESVVNKLSACKNALGLPLHGNGVPPIIMALSCGAMS